MTRRIACLLMVCLGAAWLPGCAAPRTPSGALALTYGPDPVADGDGFDHALYRGRSSENLTFLLLRGPLEAPEQAAVIRMFWRPRAGRTPIDRDATNATVRYVTFNEAGQVALYSGAGFLYPRDAHEAATFRAELWEASLRLSDGSEDFTPPARTATLSGQFKARRDPEAVHEALGHLRRRVSAALGRPRMVRGE